jgi:hypothetical protein
MSISKFKSSFVKDKIDHCEECKFSIKIKKNIFVSYIEGAIKKSKKIRHNT